jgi:hypothetical protein
MLFKQTRLVDPVTHPTEVEKLEGESALFLLKDELPF